MRFLPWQHGLKTRTSTQWTTLNPVLRAGQVGYESDSGWFKVGDGVTAWNDNVNYFIPGAGGGGASDLILGITSSTAHRGDHGSTAYNHSLATGNPHSATQDDIGDGATYKQYSATEQTKLAGIEAGADVTDSAAIIAAGALLESAEAQIVAVRNYNHFSSWVSMSSLLTDAAANPNEIYVVTIDETPPLIDDMSCPPNLFFDFSKEYGLRVNDAQIFYINAPLNAPMHRIFWGNTAGANTGQVRIRETAGFYKLYAIWYLDDGTIAPVAISASQSEAMRYAPFLNNGGRIIFPNGRYTIDHDWTLQRGAVEGSANDSNVNGTKLERVAGGTGQPAFFRVLPGSRQVSIKNMVLTTDLADCCHITARGAGGDGAPVDQTSDGILLSNITAEGGSEGFRIHDSSIYKNWQCHNVFIDNLCNFLGQTVACLRTNTVNGGFISDAANLLPAKNGTSAAWLNEGCAKVTINLHAGGQVAEALPGNPSAGVKFTFVSGDVNTGANSITEATAGDLETNDSVYFTTTDTLPDPLELARKYWWNATNSTLHTNPEESQAGTNPVDLTDGGTGTHTLWSTRPNPVATPDQPFAVVKIAGPYSEGITLSGNQRDEGIPWLLYVDPATPDNDAAGILFDNILSQGQVFFGSDVSLTLIDGQYPADSFKDAPGVFAKVRNYGAKAYTYGIGGPKNNYGGYATPSPHSLDDFCGNSVFLTDHNLHDADIHARNANDVYIWGLRVRVPGGAIRNITQKVKRLSSGALTGFWKWDNSYAGLNDAQVGNWFDGGIANSGRWLNARTDTGTGTSGTITLNLRLGSFYRVVPTGNATIEFENPNIGTPGDASTGFNHPVYLLVKTSGTTSYDLTEGTNVKMLGTLATGTTDGAYFYLKFIWDKTEEKFIEVGRAPGAGGSGSVATDAIFDAKGDLAVGTGADTSAKLTVGANDTFLLADSAQATGVKWTNTILRLIFRGTTSAIQFFDRATNATSFQIYSDISGDAHLYRDLSGGNVVSITGGNLLSLPSAVKASFGRKYRIGGTASSATPTPDADTQDVYVMTGAAAAFEWQIPSGTPYDRQRIRLWAKDDGTSRAITYNAIYRAIDVNLPKQTVVGKWVKYDLEYDLTAVKWNVTDVSIEGVGGFETPVFDIRSYGAKVDGTTDDAAAVRATMEAAIAANGGIIFFPPGTTRIATAVVTSAEGVLDAGATKHGIYIFQGAGTRSIIKVDAELGGALFRMGNTSIQAFRDLTILGQNTGAVASAAAETSYLLIAVTTSWLAVFERVVMAGVKSSGTNGVIYIGQDTNVAFRDCFFGAVVNPNGGTITLDSVNSFVMDHCQFFDYHAVGAVMYSTAEKGGAKNWIRTGTTLDVNQARKHPLFRISNTSFDENTSEALLYLDGSGTRSLELKNVSSNGGVGALPTGKFFNFKTVKVLDSWSGYQVGAYTSFEFDSCEEVILDGLAHADGATDVEFLNSTKRVTARRCVGVALTNTAGAYIDADQAMPTTASATALIPKSKVTHVTGTTTVTSITATNFKPGDELTLIFDDALTMTDGNNLNLAGNFTTTAGDVLKLSFDGTNFNEVSRSVN